MQKGDGRDDIRQYGDAGARWLSVRGPSAQAGVRTRAEIELAHEAAE